MRRLQKYIAIVFAICGVPVLYGAYQWLGIQNAAPVYALAFALAGLILLTRSKSLLRRRAHALFYLLFAVLLVATLLVWPRAGFTQFYEQVKSLALCFIWSSPFFVLYFLISDRPELRFAYRALAITGLIVSLSVLADYVMWTRFGISFGEIVDSQGQLRAFGPLGDQVGFVIILFALRALQRRDWVALAFHTTAIVLTGTRGALLALVVGVLWLLVVVPFSEPARSGQRIRTIVSTLVLSVVLVVSLLSTPLGESTYNRLFEGDALQSGLLQRAGAMQLGVKIFGDNPLIGVGYLGFNSLSDEYGFWKYFKPGADVERSAYTANNQLIQTATDAGIFGTLAFLALFATIVRNCRRARMQASGEDRHELVSIESWLAAILIGNQAAVWLLPSAATGYFVFVAAAISERVAFFQAQRAVATREGDITPTAAMPQESAGRAQSRAALAGTATESDARARWTQ